MSNQSFQPLSSIGPTKPEASETDSNNPAKNDYREGRKLFDDGEYAQAAIAFHNALRGFEEQEDEQGVANAADRLGDACLARDEYAMALANYQRAHGICTKQGDSFSLLALHKKMAAAHRKLGDYAATMELLYDILEHYRLTNNPKGAVETLIALAEVFKEQDNKAAAADAYRSAASIHAGFKHARMAEQLNQLADELES